MTTITKTIYVAFDGTEFDAESACRTYEAENAIPSGVTVYDADLDRTTDPNRAIFIVVDHDLSETENYQLLKWINSAVDVEGEPEAGHFECGVYAWDYFEDRYNHIPKSNIDTYRRLFDLAEKECF